MNTGSVNIAMDRELQAENQELRQRLSSLMEEARLNEKKWRRLEQLEKQLIATNSLAELIRIILEDYKTANEIDAVTLVLADPEYEITRTLESATRSSSKVPGLVILEQIHTSETEPYLGNFEMDHPRAIFDPWPADCQSMLLLPLIRHGKAVGSLNLASREAARFAVSSSTDFLERLAAIFSLCLENALNQERLKLVGLTDPLTGIYNRRYFEARCHDEIRHAERHEQPLSCMLLDIDKFKQINDTLGHLAGDEVLRVVTERIKLQLRSNDIFARYGGEEFVVLLPQTSTKQAFQIAERIRATIASRPVQPLPDQELNVTISIGVSQLLHRLTEDRAMTFRKLVDSADGALYHAKENGRNRVMVGE